MANTERIMSMMKMGKKVEKSASCQPEEAPSILSIKSAPAAAPAPDKTLHRQPNSMPDLLKQCMTKKDRFDHTPH